MTFFSRANFVRHRCIRRGIASWTSAFALAILLLLIVVAFPQQLFGVTQRAVVPEQDADVLFTFGPNGNDSQDCQQRFPSVIVAGFGKCGTGTFMRFIGIHPNVCVVPGEVHFFVGGNYERGLDWYRTRMSCSFSNQITIEKSPGYAIRPEAPERVFDFDRNMKLIFIVRDPIERIISRYSTDNRIEKKPKTISEVLLPDGSVDPSHAWVENSRFYVSLQLWLTYFPPKQIHVIDGRNFVRHPAEELQKVEKFLNLRPYIKPEHFVFDNEKGFYCVKLGNNSVDCMGKGKGIPHRDLDEDILRELRLFFRKENADLFSLLKRTFNWTDSSLNLLMKSLNRT